MGRKKKETPNPRIKTSILIDQKIWADFTRELKRKHIDYSHGLEMLAKQFVHSGSDVAGLRKALEEAPRPVVTRDEIIRLVDEIIESGSEHIYAIYVNLELLRYAVKSMATFSIDEVRRLRQILTDAEEQKLQALAPETIPEPSAKPRRGRKRKLPSIP